tara:strand:- start:377 stop:667 length:291 start_codon:yes stop_codon:yes gene_type:complete
MTEHSKYYYDYKRNTTDEGGEVCENANKDNFNIPDYYIGKNGYMAKDVVANFDLTYNLGTACTYILRAYRKHKTPIDCIKKAIAHLEFEIEKLKQK